LKKTNTAYKQKTVSKKKSQYVISGVTRYYKFKSIIERFFRSPDRQSKADVSICIERIRQNECIDLSDNKLAWKHIHNASKLILNCKFLRCNQKDDEKLI
jgi:hypothetical protein